MIPFQIHFPSLLFLLELSCGGGVQPSLALGADEVSSRALVPVSAK